MTPITPVLIKTLAALRIALLCEGLSGSECMLIAIRNMWRALQFSGTAPHLGEVHARRAPAKQRLMNSVESL